MITEILRPIEQVHGNGHNGHRAALTIPLEYKAASPTELSPGINVQAFTITELQKRIFAQNPEINERVEELDEVSERWMKAKLSGSNYSFAWETLAGDEGDDLRRIIEGVRLPISIGNEIGEMYDKLCEKVGEEDVTVAVRRRLGIGEISLQKGKNGVSDATRRFLAIEFAARTVRGRNEARLEMLQSALKDNPNIDGALKKSEVLSHAKSSLTVVVQRWQMPSRQK